ncbi:MAG: hypothetical protein CVV24_01680 [Ignavibacteriae bacterium HGW-Ignavibacteriae-3]|nr:MAG: hypothetical protein CVV24_01680 [Ignavibacteriae bacterium HGW-Ignavibacteriae-3]
MIDRSAAPAPEKKLTFDLPEIKELSLSNGTKVLFVRKDKLPIVYTNLIISCGSKSDPAAKRGTGYLTSLLVDEGAGKFDSLELNGEFEKLGSIFSVRSNHDMTSMTLTSLKDNFNRSLELMSDVILTPRFDEKDFAREKKKVLDKILQLKDEPSFIASSVFERKIFKDSYYAFPEIGFENTVADISNNDIKKFYTQNYTAANSTFVVVGNLTESEVTDKFNGYFSKWDSSKKSSAIFEKPERAPTSFYFVHKKDSAQSEIRIGHLAKKRDAADFIPARIMNTILGGQFSSRINLNLREDKGFTYGANSSFQYYREAGLFEVSTAVNIENTGEAVSEILKELDGIRKEITPKEIEFAKSYLIKQFPARFETYAQVAKNIEQLILHRLDIDDLRGYTGKIESTEIREVSAAALENIFPEELVVVAVGEKEKIIPQLKKIKGVEPEELDLNGNPQI